MQLSRPLNGLFLLVALAAIGLLMVWLPAQAVQQYHAVKELGTTWVTLYFVFVGAGAVLFLGTTGSVLWTLWSRTRRKKQRREQREKNPSALSARERQQEYDENLAEVERVRADPHVSEELKRQLQPLVNRLEEKREEQRLEIVAFGTISSGKSSLLNALAGREVFATDLKGGTTVNRQDIPWPGIDRVILVDTPGLAEVDAAEHIAVAAEAARDADVVLMVVDGPLRDSEHQLLARLGEMEKRIILCLNKEDWYTEQDKAELLGQIRRQAAPFTESDDVVAVRSQATHRLRIRVTAAGDEVEEQVEVPPDISPLAARLMRVVRREGADILLANLLLQSRGLVEEARVKVQAAVDQRAWQIVDRYTWGAGGAAALSPTPVLDLLAGSAITAKMVVDLAGVYRQDVDLNTAVQLLGQLGKNLIAILGVSAATPAVVSSVASLLKTVPGAGTIAGGVLQGVVQAIVTRWIGAVFVEYFRNEMKQPEGGLTGLARRQWQHVTSLVELHRFVQEARMKLLSAKNK
jgi:small GTP-binding protein